MQPQRRRGAETDAEEIRFGLPSLRLPLRLCASTVAFGFYYPPIWLIWRLPCCECTSGLRRTQSVIACASARRRLTGSSFERRMGRILTSPPSNRHERSTPSAVSRKRLHVAQNGADI